MPTLQITVRVNGRPLRRAYVEHLVLGVGQDALLLTDDRGRVRDQAGNLGLFSVTRDADIRILCQNSVVKVLDGKTVPVPLGVHRDVRVRDGSVVDLDTSTEQADHYETLERCGTAYDVVFRQFQAFSDDGDPDFPLGRRPTLRSTKDQSKRIEVSFPSQFPLGEVAFVEPRSVATGFPLVHLRDDVGALFGTDGRSPTLAAGELAHALHFARFSAADRAAIETRYVGWISTDLANGGDGRHAIGRRTSPEVAYLEAADHFAGRFSEYVRRALQGGTSTRVRVQAPTSEIRRDFVASELTGPLVGTRVGRLRNGRVVPDPALHGSDDEGSVYGCIFLDFARRVGMRTAVNAYFRSAAAGATTFGGYRAYVADERPQELDELDAAAQTWGL